MTIQAVVFDIGNVLIEWQPERFFDRMIGETGRRQLFAAVDLHSMNDRVDLGEGFRDIIYETANIYPDYYDEICLWHDRWIEMASPEIPRSVKLMRSLRKKGIPVFALSNFGIESFALAQSKYAFLTEFDRPYISGHLRMAKPDPAIYEHVEQDSGVAPAELLFVDDRADNIEAARVRGWHTHEFTTADGWAKSLVTHGLLSAEEAAS